MPRKTIENPNNGFAEKRLKNDVVNDLITELGRDGLDDSSVFELVKGLRQNHLTNGAVIKLSEALGLEPEEERNGNDLVGGNQVLSEDSEKYNQTGPENIAGADDDGDGKPVANIEKCTSVDFYRALGIISQTILNNETGG